MEKPDRKLHRLPTDVYAFHANTYFFTICARHLTRPFENRELASAVVEALLWRKRQHQWVLHCYCLMPDHLHFIARLQTESPRVVNAGARGLVTEGILDHIRQFKRYTTRIWWRQGGEGRLWQRSSYDHVFRYSESVADAAWYVLMNPVRKGLVDKWDDYPHAGIVDPWW